MNRKSLIFISCSFITICLIFGTIFIARAYKEKALKTQDEEIDDVIGPSGKKPFHRYYGRHKEKGLRGGSIKGCLNRLDLSVDQIKQLKQISQKHREGLVSIQKSMKKLREMEIRYVYEQKEPDEKALEEILQEGAQLWKKRELARLKYRQEIAGFLTPEQKNRLYNCESSRQKSRWERGSDDPLELE